MPDNTLCWEADVDVDDLRGFCGERGANPQTRQSATFLRHQPCSFTNSRVSTNAQHLGDCEDILCDQERTVHFRCFMVR
jgi:hypothetical protein